MVIYKDAPSYLLLSQKKVGQAADIFPIFTPFEKKTYCSNDSWSIPGKILKLD